MQGGLSGPHVLESVETGLKVSVFHYFVSRRVNSLTRFAQDHVHVRLKLTFIEIEPNVQYIETDTWSLPFTGIQQVYDACFRTENPVCVRRT